MATNIKYHLVFDHFEVDLEEMIQAINPKPLKTPEKKK